MDVELKEASGGLLAYSNARSETLVVTGIGAGCPGVGPALFFRVIAGSANHC